MKISINTIQAMNQRYSTTGDLAPDGVEKLVEKIGAQLGGVDEVIDFGKKYENIAVVKVVSCTKHPDADKLNVCQISDDSFFERVERNEQHLIQVVCGAPNVREGMLAVWIPPGVIVPNTADKDPFVLEVRDIRGQKSNGMLASLKELGLGDNHDGILEVEEKVEPGVPFSEAYDLDDYIIDIENKMFTHRPDLFGFLGVARELAGIQGMPFKSPEWYTNPKIPEIEAEELKLEVKNDLPELVPRFTAITMRDVKVGPSPLWLQIFLAKMGQKSINNIVDYTNFFMHETAQPLHAYDYDKLAKNKTQSVRQAQDKHAISIEVRKSRKGDKLKLLNGKEITFDDDNDILITSNDKPIGIGGVMGGSETEVDETTKNIVIECANFDMYAVRRTAMARGLFTDAVTRFTKGQSPLQNVPVLTKIVDEIQKYAGGKVASDVVDITSRQSLVASRQVKTSPGFVNSRLGLELSGEEMATFLRNVELKTTDDSGLEAEDSEFGVQIPFWRTDIEIPEDIVEEVGRLYGYDRLPQDLPKRSIVPVGPDSMLRLKQRLRETLARFGANEVLTYSFVHGDLLDKAGQKKQEAYTISNALSPDLQYYRLSLTPSLLSHVHPNIKAAYDSFALFELGKTHNKTHELIDDVPKEIDTLGLVIASRDKNNDHGSPFYAARTYLDQLATELDVELVYYPAERDPNLPMTAPFELSRSAFVTIKDSKGMLGIVGEYKQSVIKNMKLPARSSGFEIGVKELLAQIELNAGSVYKPLSRYPGTKQDMCFHVSIETTYKDLYETVKESLAQSPLESRVELVDIYQPESGEYKNITLRIHLTNHEHTISSDETKATTQTIAELTANRLNAKVI